MIRRITLAAAFTFCLANCGQKPEPAVTKAPILANRQQIILERDRMARQLLPPGDSLTIYVFMMIDARGLVHQPEVKDQADPRAVESALRLVSLMRFRPAQQAGQPVPVLLKVPVRFVRPVQP